MAVGLTGLFVLGAFYALVGIPIGAIFLRAGIAIANRILGPVTGEPVPLTDMTIESEARFDTTRDLKNPYSAPLHSGVPLRLGDEASTAIPVPVFWRAYFITFAQAIAIGIAEALLAVCLTVLRTDSSIFISGLAILVGFVVSSLVLSSMGQTTLKRAMLATVLTYLIVVAFLLVIAGSLSGLAIMN